MTQLLPGGMRHILRSLSIAGSAQAAGSTWSCAAGLATSAVQQSPILQQLPQLLQQHSFPWQHQQLQLPCWHQQSRVMSSWTGMDDSHRHSTTILCVRRGSEVVIIGDGQATQQDFIVKSNVRKVRRIGPNAVGGFAGVAVDGLALLERLEGKLEEHPGQLQRAAVELAKMWRQDKLLRELDASLIVADAETTLWLMGNGDVLEAGADGVIGIGSGADFAESAAKALLQVQKEQQEQQQGTSSEQQQAGSVGAAAGGEGGSVQGRDSSGSSASSAISSMSLFDVATAAMQIAADSCVYTNANFSWHHIQPDGTIVSGDSASGATAEQALHGMK